MSLLRRTSAGRRLIAAALTAMGFTMATAQKSPAQQPATAPAPAPCLGYSYNIRPTPLLAGGVQTVAEVQPGTPAEAGGLRPRDILVSIAGVLTTSATPPRLVPGDTIDFLISRDGRNVTLIMIVGRREPSPSGDPVCRPAVRPSADR